MEPIIASELIQNDMKTGENMCPICYECLTNENKYIIPECKHAFHSNCIIPWFRGKNSTCPYCRSVGNSKDQSYWTIKGRFTFNKNFSRRKNAPKSLKLMVEKYKRRKDLILNNKKKHTEWKKSDEGKTYSKLRTKSRRLRNSAGRHRWGNGCLYDLEARIAEYPIVAVPIPTPVKN